MKKLLIFLLLFATTAEAQWIIPDDTTDDTQKSIPVYLVDNTDGVTPETGVTITGAECEVSKNGGAWTSCSTATDGAWSEVGDGVYEWLLDDADVTTAGSLVIKIDDVTIDHRVFIKEAQVIPNRNVNVASFDAGVIDAAAIGTAAIDADAIAADAIGSSEIATDAIGAAEIASGAIVEGTEATGWNNISTADVNTQCDLALTDINLDHLMAVAVTGTEVIDNSVIAFLAASGATADWDTFVNTDDSLQAISEGGASGDWTATEKENIRDALGVTGTKTAASGGDLQDLDAKVPDTVSLANINAQCDTAIETYRLDELFNVALGSQPTAGSFLGDLTEDDAGTQRFTVNALEQAPGGGGSCASAWDCARSSHTTPGTFGESVNVGNRKD